ncbi:ClpXP protease specificity-enhancing factor [Candidatus Methylobacter oryzae]|uniref:ClpXP protease specificity-enhancing factor n=1 Tax=Candidatus Methylobacter oryzae TaxID=2497749 RepID=A0ABY3CHQ9_9GAMM|nr:ClpXP protease specificity-enhancing factor [Candidatus Methylobacter oryzae]TRX03835.1 ClpXP protease specificity-enhancing factor [Candidatus Methylobacter oryzae]
MTSLKPYLIRSIYEWIIDNSLTPHLLVDAENTSAILPQEFIEDGKIVLNIRPEAIQGLSLGNEEIEFNARFSGKPMHIVTPVTAVLAIYAKENGKGMIFDQEEHDDNEPPPPEKKPAAKPNLRIVK